jgi:hypothetical protein
MMGINGSKEILMNHNGSCYSGWVSMGLDGFRWITMGFDGFRWITMAPMFFDGYQLILMGPDGSQWLFWLIIGTNL